MGNDRARIIELIEILNPARKAYYADGTEIMSNFAYDKLYDELEALEKKTGIVLASSPTREVGYEVVSALPKEKHPAKMLSLDKTKSVDDLASFAGDNPCLLSWKLDGLTVVLTYAGGKLRKAVTRGNGEIGEVITPNAKVFANLPLAIPYTGDLVLRGEAIIPYSGFEEINRTLPEAEAKYKNPRNLCSGSVRQLNSEITAQRGVRFIAFSLVEGGAATGPTSLSEGQEVLATDENGDFVTRSDQLAFLESQGFEVVEHKVVKGKDMAQEIACFADKIAGEDYPSDGLVLTYDDIAYGKSLGATVKFPRDSIAFKWQDETAETTLREIIWSASRTGLLNPIAVFDPVELEGTTVSRAGVHNVSILQDLKLGIGDTVVVYKANMIIPQISENKTGSNNVAIPDACPVCGGKTRIKEGEGVKVLSCINQECPAKKINAYAHFVSRDALNMDGMSSATVERLVDMGIVKTFGDFFRLDRFKEPIIQMEGFGEKSYEKMIKAAAKASHTTAARLLYGLGIPGIGSANADIIAQVAGEDMSKIRHLTKEELLQIDGVGGVLAEAFTDYFAQPENTAMVDDLLDVLTLAVAAPRTRDLEGMTFVVTGSLAHYDNRDQLKEEILGRGGKVAGSVSKNTDYLINNDINSGSGKNQKAKELGVPIITEDEYMARFGQ